jgi:5-methyltetrahydropteroyltriglutamate--homocysteine methyltransferase
MVLTTTHGYPRIGPKRELKKATEAYWSGEMDEERFLEAARAVRRENWREQAQRGIDLVPSGDFSLYDPMLDMALALGAVPRRFREEGLEGLRLLFAMARGTERSPACEMTKWFDTNYHYIVPEIEDGFAPDPSAYVEAFQAARSELDLETKPILIGPLTFLWLSKVRDPVRFRKLLRELGAAYRSIVAALVEAGARWIELDESALVLDETSPFWEAMEAAYGELARGKGPARLLVSVAYGDVAEAWPTLLDLPVDGIGLDLVHGRRNREMLLHSAWPPEKLLVAGIVDGRNVWRTDLEATLDFLEAVQARVPRERLLLAPSCNLLHLPYSVELEPRLDRDLARQLAFARERLGELAVLKKALAGGREAVAASLEANRELMESRRRARREGRVSETLDEEAFRRPPFAQRRPLQEKRLGLPLLPTTTIGSFPQTPEVRRARARYRSGRMSEEAYRRFVEERIQEVVRLQEEVGLDVLVHGEFERADMVEFFAERLDGTTVTRNGWVQSYGTRYVRPPIIHGDVSRPGPMSVREVAFAQSLTRKPVKGMLTGPVTILNWSYPRVDLPRKEIAFQIALALREETRDLEAAGIRIIQIDEPAFREGLPLKRSEWAAYLSWAVKAFRLASSGVAPETQIHTHMCYSDFNDIIEAIADLDADVISIENSRSAGELLEAFREFRYPRWIGPGVYDVHSERIPSVEEMVDLIRRSAEVLPRELLWVNPDCGLKTRRFEEVVPSLRNMVAAARRVREAWAGASGS